MAELSAETLAKLEGSVLEEWDTNDCPVLFSEIPALMKREHEVDIRAEIYPRKLIDAIMWAQPQRVRIIRHPSDEKILALVPSSIQEDAGAAFARLRLRSEKRKAETRYLHAVWSAFSKPLTNERRFLFVGDSVYFEDASISHGLPEGGIPVRSELVRQPGEALDNAEIASRIEAWLRENPAVVRASVLDQGGERRDNDILGRFARLSEEDQRRITIPLDIVAKLLS